MSDIDEDGGDKTMIMAPSVKKKPPPKAKLVCIDPSVLGGAYGREVSLDNREITFGRGDENTVTLAVSGVSRSHARVYPGDAVWGVEDLGSTNGIMVNKSKVERAWLNPGDIVSIGKVHYKFGLVEDEPTKPAPSSHSVDISESDKTVVMRPGAAKPAAPAAAAAKPGTSTATGATKTSARPATRPRAAAPQPKSGGGGMLWVVLVIGAALVAGTVFLLL